MPPRYPYRADVAATSALICFMSRTVTLRDCDGIVVSPTSGRSNCATRAGKLDLLAKKKDNCCGYHEKMAKLR
eukprot:9479715-Pyramimonas_sp.AAC.1